MARRILLLALLAHAQLPSAMSEESSGTGSGDGSGADRCTPPEPRPEFLGGAVDTAGDLEPRCHLACIERISSEEGIDMEDLVSTAYPIWPMIPDSVLENNCSLFKKVQMCRESCSLITLTQCQRKCDNESCDTPDPSSCQICRQDHCATGCELKQELEHITSMKQDFPPAPKAPLDLIIADGFDDISPHISDAGLYRTDPMNAVPIETNSSAVRHPTIIIVRVRKEKARKQKYVWMTSFEEILNLTAYACQDVKLQFGAINKFGLAQGSYTFRTSLTLEVYGESPPTYAAHPSKVNITVAKDVREGYWKHAVVTIRWKKPTKGFELMDHYEARFKLEQPEEQPYCKPTSLTKRMNKTAETDVKWIISAESPGDGPVSDCHYTVQVESISVNRSIQTYSPDVYRVHISSSRTDPVPLMDSWNQTWDEKSGNFTYKLDWSMPDNENLQRAVGLFEVIVDLIAPDNTRETLFSTIYPTNVTGGVQNYHHSQEVKYDEINYRHQITLKAHPGDVSLVVLIPTPRTRTFSAAAITPDQVVEVKADFEVKESDAVKGSVTLDISVEWEELNTQSIYYQLRVVRENTTGSIEALHELQLTEPRALITGLTVKLEQSLPCLYIQVKAVTQFMAEGAWSDAVCLKMPPPPPLPPSSSSSTPPTPGETLGDGPSSSKDNGQVVYIIVSVTVLLVVCVIVLFVVIFLAYYPTLRNRKQKGMRRIPTVFMTRKASEKDKYTAAKLDQWEVYSNQVAIQSRLGEGAFGEVYRGLFDSSITEKSSTKKFDASNSVVVAVKLLRDDAQDRDRQIFLKHILQAKKVAQYQHPHLVCMVGCVTEMEPLSLLTEYPEQGDLLTYLRTQRMEIYQSKLQILDYQNGASGGKKLHNIVPQCSSEQSLQAQDLMLFASHVAAGLEHLASIGVVHGDVACRNLFLTANKVVKIADFGLDGISEEEKGLVYMKSELGRLPIRWMAMESIREGEFSTSSDVWSFGVTLWEIASLGGFPYHDTANCDVLAILSAGQRLLCPTNCSEEIYGIMLKCCAAFPGDRPSFSTLHHVFKSLHTTANDGQYITLNVDPSSPYYLSSPRSSVIDPASLSVADDRTPLVTTEAHLTLEVDVVPTRPDVPPSVEDFPPQSPEITHFHSASYSYSEAGTLPCITEEGEDVDNEDEEEREEGEGEEEKERDSSNDSTYSHESAKFVKLSDKNDSEESLIVGGATQVEFV